VAFDVSTFRRFGDFSMQLMPVLLLAVVMAVDGGLQPIGALWGLSNWFVVTMTVAPVALIVLLSWAGLRWCDRRLDRGEAYRAVNTSDRIMRWSRWLVLANHAFAVLVLNWVGVVRDALGDVVVLDEFAAIVPPLLGLVGLWWAYYPIDRRLRDAMLIRRLDEGRPVYPTLRRGTYVLMQLRMQVLLMLAPLLLIVALAEVVDLLVPSDVVAVEQPTGGVGWRELLTLGVAAGVFLCSPLLARVILDMQPLPAGEVRDDLASVCHRHRVKIRDMLLWNTNGSMINAAVMGLIGPLRYVMLTDALLETLQREQVLAVMAHEIGHVRRHHMPWLVACLLAAFVVAWLPVELGFRAIEAAGFRWTDSAAQWMGVLGTALQLIGGLLIFGWLCRRFERQADTFAVQHLSAAGPAAGTGGITAQAVYAMCTALETIADLNSVERERSSWRHGSIGWRQRYLLSIIGRPAAQLPIDRLIRRLKITAAILLLLAGAMEAVRLWSAAEAEPAKHTRAAYADVARTNEPRAAS
jgi:STE24 endopeptidase